MSSINNVGNTNPLQQITAQPVQKQVPTAPPAQVAVTDKLDLSGISPFLKALQTNNIRTDKVASIKAAIADGTYEDDHKLNVAADKLLDELQK